ncbi:hypothetical protein WN48_08104 [Eufriesea mexicana]|uniref:ZAD domain-containing protein n=1 Tax=Eufriesea mexicana TaxID=516756 RepID=A0A310S815_9HYME|nr:hypothetical protein WN48_08104 [Eufriesea mexicana]
METLESSRVCRLCGKQSGISINIFDKNENHVKKINAILPVMVHEMDLLPKHMCHRCSYKLEEFHKFYVDCLKTDADLKSQLSWMRKEDSKERVGVPMVHIENIKIKVEPPDCDIYDINPMVSDVDYINSMNSVAFPVNGVQSNNISDRITYTAYARCGCYCDKADQSNQTIPTNYENNISRCSRINDVRPGNNDCVNKSQTVKGDLLTNNTLEQQSNLVRLVNEVKDSRRIRQTSSGLSLAKSKPTKANKKAARGTIVRNLRPRKGSVDYVGVRKKLPAFLPSRNENKSKTVETKMSVSTGFDVTQIKMEKLDNFEGRILRPRKGTIDYIGPKRKYSRSNKNQRLQNDEHQVDKTKLKNSIQLGIKEEQLSDLEDLVLDESVSAAMLSLTDQIDALPNDYDVNVQNGRDNHNTLNHALHTGNFSIAKWKPLRNVSKSKLKSGKIGLNRISGMNYSPKYLRSQDACLRSGKIRKLDNVNVSVRKLRRSLRNLIDRSKTTSKALMKTIRGTVTAKMSTSVKMIDIKHYCEECNTSFANKELFKLHACYGH